MRRDIRIEFGEILRLSPYSVRMRENADRNNSEYRHFSRSAKFSATFQFCLISLLCTNYFIQDYFLSPSNSDQSLASARPMQLYVGVVISLLYLKYTETCDIASNESITI